MRVVFVGGGTGGHFYPLIAVAERIDRLARVGQLLRPQMHYMGPSPYDEKALYNAGIEYHFCPAGKLRRTRDLLSRVLNALSMLGAFFFLFKALATLYRLFPDVVFSKGGYASFPTLLAARILRIPVVIHDSDSKPGRVSLWSASFAKKIALGFPSALDMLSPDERSRAAVVGVPIRYELLRNPMETARAHELLKLDDGAPVVLVLGGSQGAAHINEAVLDALPNLLKQYQVVHQTGEQHVAATYRVTQSMLRGMQGIHTYHPVPFLGVYHLRAAYSVASIVISRAGAGVLFELAEWGIPAIVIPIPVTVSHDQVKNAYAYARNVGASVIEEQNLTPHLLCAQVDGIMQAPKARKTLERRARAFVKEDAAEKIAKQIVHILKAHES